ncbi:MAG: rod shape-determining protein MreC [Atopobiaceae bacterium]|nr:rod shape-determining protein MreC [Atopobiaceae bacterium]
MPKMPSMHGGRAKSTSSKLRRSEPGGSAGLLTVVLSAIAILIFTLSVREGGEGFFSSTRSVVQTIVSPIRMLGGYATAPFSGMSNVMRNLTADEQTLEELKQENAQLTARNIELEEAQQTARRLEELLDLRNTYNLQSIVARIISGPSDSWAVSVVIDKGSAAGVRVGMPVSNSMGAVGQVIECSASTSVVRLLTDEGSSVSAMVQSSRAQGMLEGSADSSLRLSLIRTDQSVDVGDVVVTSGLGGVFPKGLPVGKVATIEKNPGSTYYAITVDPYYRPETLEEVLVITSLTEEQQATSEDIENADKPDLEAASGRGASAASKGEGDGKEDANEEEEKSSEEGDDTADDDAAEEGTDANARGNERDRSDGSDASDAGSTSYDESYGYDMGYEGV